VNEVSQVYDPTRNTIYIGPPPFNPNVRHYVFAPGPRGGTVRVRVPVAYRVSAARAVSTVYRTVVLTAAQAKALRTGTDVIAWTVHGKNHMVTNPRVVPASRDSSSNESTDDASNLDPFSGTFRGQILAVLRSGHARVAVHATVDGRDTIKIESADGHTTYYVEPGSYTPVELTTKGTTGGSILRFDTYEQLPLNNNSDLLSLTTQHPTATVDRNTADYQAAKARLFPHG